MQPFLSPEHLYKVALCPETWMVADSAISVQLHLLITMEKADVNWDFPAE